MLVAGLAAIGGIGITLFGYGVGVYNTIVTAKNDWEGQMADIKTEYQRRIDLYMNLVKTVKSHKKFEKETIIELTKARSGITEQKNIKPTTIKKLDSFLGSLKVQMEAYPELKSHTHYTKLMEEIGITEERILVARGELNNIAEDYNTYIQKFPTVLFVGIFNAKKLSYIELTYEANSPKAPEMDI